MVDKNRRDKTTDSSEEREATDRRNFLKQAATAAAAAGLTAAPILASASTSQSQEEPSLTRPISWRILKSNTTKQGTIQESTGEFELTGGNGAKHLFTMYSRRIEVDGGHETVMTMRIDRYASSSDVTPVSSELQTVMTSLKRGMPGENGLREDEVVVTIFDKSGARKFPAMTVKVPAQNPYAGMSDEEQVNAILNAKLGSK